VQHEPAEYTKLNLAGTRFAFTRGAPVAVKVEVPGDSAQMEKLRAEMAELRNALAAAEGNAAEVGRLQGELRKAQEKAAETSPVPAAPTTPMARTDPALAAAFPASRGMEGSRAGEVREFGGIEVVWCPPGKFMMGSPENEEGREDDEVQHEVTLTRGFWLAKTETTRGQWESVMGENPSAFEGVDLPVEAVSWDDVQSWLAEMNRRHPLLEGWKWDLPTEAQWEYACRAGADGKYALDGDLDEICWWGLMYIGGTKAEKVATKKPNNWGLYDMHGNVSEWCRDWHGNYSRGSVTDPTGPKAGSVRVHRGGSWVTGHGSCRSAAREVCSPETRYPIPGFRAAAVPGR